MTHRLRGLGTGAWYGDDSWDLAIPENWQLTIHWPQTPAPLTDYEIADALANPVGHSPFRNAVQRASRPLVLVDDLTRPTPADRVMPFVLDEFRAAGVRLSDVTILMGTGTHSSTGVDAAKRKVGPEAAESCRLVVHDDRGKMKRVGKTSFGTPIFVNPLVAESDFVCGIGGVYPQHAVGFGGGSKLVLGALGRRTIAALHYGHERMNGRYDVDNDFRRDLDEIATTIGLDFLFTSHVDAGRSLVRLVCGDWRAFYPDEVAFAKETYAAPLPAGADVVISNSYPIDISLTFMRSKGIIPLVHAAPSASKILLSGCAEGTGRHGLFPLERTSVDRAHHLARQAWFKRSQAPAKVAGRLRRKVERSRIPANGTSPSLPMRLLLSARPALPDGLSGFVLAGSWNELVGNVRAEQGDENLEVVVYPCAPLQVLGDGEGDA